MTYFYFLTSASNNYLGHLAVSFFGFMDAVELSPISRRWEADLTITSANCVVFVRGCDITS